MKKILKSAMLLLTLVNAWNDVEAGNEQVFVDRMIIGNNISGIANSGLPKKDMWSFHDADQTILFYAKIGVINPILKTHTLEYTCTDQEGNLVIKGTFKNNPAENTVYHLGPDTLKSQIITLELNPKPGALVKGQINPLKKDNIYFIKIYFEKNLIGISEFDYRINN